MTSIKLKQKTKGYRLRHAKVTVCEDLEGEITIIYKGEKLPYKCYKKQKKTAAIVGAKAINHKINSIIKRRRKPSMNHPWRQYKTAYRPLVARC